MANQSKLYWNVVAVLPQILGRKLGNFLRLNAARSYEVPETIISSCQQLERASEGGLPRLEKWLKPIPAEDWNLSEARINLPEISCCHRLQPPRDRKLSVTCNRSTNQRPAYFTFSLVQRLISDVVTHLALGIWDPHPSEETKLTTNYFHRFNIKNN
ncbi:hypothetical protein J6590_031504 [Homalodisca vitripennis]|nr:hypothetical protein J6590_031504 [Homalodisca vitripennis]